MKKKYSVSEEVLLATDRRVNSTSDPLARIFRRLLLDGNITPSTMSILMDRYIRKKSKNNSATRLTDKANYTSGLFKPQITFKSLLRGFKILDLTKVEITVRAHWKNGNVSEITDTIDPQWGNEEDGAD